MTTPSRPAVDLLDWVLFVPFVLLFLFSLLVLEVVHRIVVPLGGESALLSVNGCFNRYVVKLLSIVGAKVTVEGRERLVPNACYLIVSNHQSLFDIPLAISIFGAYRPRFVAKRQLARWIPGLSYNLRHGGNALIDRGNSSQALRAMSRLAERMQEERFAVVLYPEGTRARDGVLKPFKIAGITAFLKKVPDAEVVPLTIEGSWKLQTYRRGPVPRGVEINVVVGEPLKRERFRSLDELGERAHEVIQDNLLRLRVKAE